MLVFPVDRSIGVPVFRQIQEHVAAMVDEGALRPGDRLPATRALAERLSVHRSTVLRAYDELRALGYLESRAGSYTTVRWRGLLPGVGDGERNLGHWQGRGLDMLSAAQSDMMVSNLAQGLIDFERLAADPGLSPGQDLKRAMRRVLSRSDSAVLDYAHPAGWPALRDGLCARMKAYGIGVTPAEVLITHGAQHALDLIMRVFVRRGEGVVVEAPTYAMAHDLLRLHGIEPIEVPMVDDGMDLNILRRVLEQRAPRLVYTMPNFQNPTGVTTDQSHREQLLNLCQTHEVPIVEDGFEEELRYGGPVALPIKSMDRGSGVIYVGTFSKVVFSGLRVGWVAAHPAIIVPLTAAHHATCISGNTLAQAAVELYCLRGEFDIHLRRLHRIYRRRMATLLAGLDAHIPGSWHWTRPVGGYTLWLTCRRTMQSEANREEALHARLTQHGVKAALGSRYFAKPPPGLHLRLSIATVDLSEIEEGCRRLGAALRGFESEHWG